MGIIYLATNKKNGKQYVGQTMKNLDKRKRQYVNDALAKRDNYYFHRAIRKHGEKSFNWEIIDKCEKEKELNKLEIFYIQKYDTFRRGYNMTLGAKGVGSGRNHPLYGKERPEHSRRMKGKNNPMKRLENRKKISERVKGKNNPFYGKCHTVESKNKMSKAHLRENLSMETIQKMKENNRLKRQESCENPMKRLKIRAKNSRSQRRGLFDFRGGYYSEKRYNPWTKVWHAQINYNGKGRKSL